MAALLGDVLVDRGLITAHQRDHALLVQRQSGGRLGDILIGEGMMGYFGLYNALADQHKLPFANLLESPPSADLLDEKKAMHYLGLRLLPWRKQGDRVVVALCDLRDDITAWAKKHYGEAVEFAITSPLDIKRAVEKHFGLSLETHSRLSLWQERPDESARCTLSVTQKQWLAGVFLFSLAACVFSPWHMAALLFLACHVAYACTMLFKCAIFSRGAVGAHQRIDWQAALADQNHHTLPSFTILIPMFKEAQSVQHMLSAMQALDYPASKLDIKLVLEEDDEDTWRAAQQCKMHYHFDIIRVPPGTPRTKPRACNYALRFAKGDIITIYDADDRPEPLQLKKAAYLFQTLPQSVICLQARLNYYNSRQNLLTRLFSLEYALLFKLFLPGLERLGVPIPLGGTSNHIIRKRLEELGEWDPFNVTEDADLGTRLYARGFHTAMLDSDTLEESPIHLGAWIRQRSRWIKGYMQTWLVHMRQPAKLYKTLGLRGFIGFQCFVGLSCLGFLTAPFLWAAALADATGSLPQLRETLPGWAMSLAWANLAIILLSCWVFSLFCALRVEKGRADMVLAAILYPAYLVLHSIASYKALWQLVRRPHFWEKTTHGLARHDESHIIPLTEGRKLGYKTRSLLPKRIEYEGAQLAEIRQKA